MGYDIEGVWVRMWNTMLPGERIIILLPQITNTAWRISHIEWKLLKLGTGKLNLLCSFQARIFEIFEK
jgi:hypothetical protein